MRDFPPDVPDFSSPAISRLGRSARNQSFADPDVASPRRFLFWTLRQQRNVLLISSGFSLLEWLPGALGPLVVGLIVDQGILPRDLPAVIRYAVLLLIMALVGVAAGVIRHTLIVRSWLIAMYGVMKVVTRKTTQMGHVLPQRVPTGEVLSVSASDSDQFGGLTEVATRAVGAAAAFVVIAGIVLSTSLQLGLVVLITAPLLVLLAVPLLRPLERRQEIERTRVSDLTSLATDIVAGLRILRGIGGERTFARNYQQQSRLTRDASVVAGRWQAGVDAMSILFSGLFLVTLTWLGARAVADDQLSVGQLISFFGYAVFMVWPIQTFFELAQEWVRSIVSARKTVAVLDLSPPWPVPAQPAVLPRSADLHDVTSGLTVPHGQLTVIVSAVPEESAALADRLGRYLPTDADPVSIEQEKGKGARAARRARAAQREARARQLARDAELTAGRWGVTVGDVDLADVPIEDVRAHILVSDTSSLVFAGTLQDLIDPHGRLSRTEAEEALRTASAEEVFEAFPNGWQGVLDERGRGLSGGQRQRLVLARALAADPEVLILVEPTSAVDAHTEADIAARLGAHRSGRTTVITTVSPLILHHADRVALLQDGVVVAAGTHTELLRTSKAYRRVVVRSMDDRVTEEQEWEVTRV